MAAEPQSSVNEPSFDYQLLAVALEYQKSVRLALGEESKEYREFRDLYFNFKLKRITAAEAVDRIKLLFSGHQELIEGLDQYLHVETPISLEQGLSFVSRVKRAFSQEQERYLSFLRLFKEYGSSESICREELYQKTCEILQDKQDLLEEFMIFLPDTHKATFRQMMNGVGTKAQQT